MRKEVASGLLVFACGCAAGENSVTAPDDAATVEDTGTVVDAASADTSSAHDSSSSDPDSNVVVGSGSDADADAGSSDDASSDTDSATALDSGVADTGVDSAVVDANIVDSAPASEVPTSAPAAPTQAASNVISLFSAAYTGGTANGDYSGNVDSYEASCFGPPGTTFTNYTIAGTSPAASVLEYTIPANSFAIIETIGGTGGTAVPAMCNGGTQTGADEINATAMTHMHVDVWSPQGTTNFQVHLVGAGGSGTIVGAGGSADASAGTDYATGALEIVPGAWVGIDIAMSQFGPAGAPSLLNKLALVKFFTTEAGTFFIDNVYLYE